MNYEGETNVADLLRENEIDIVLVIGGIPETFSFVTFEALQAGSLVFAYEESGNVASVIRASKQGRLFNSFDELAAGLLDFSEGKGRSSLFNFSFNPSKSPLLEQGATS